MTVPPRLTDFGVAHMQRRERVTETGAAVGTIHYLAPEAIEGEPPDARTDIWAFGVLLFEMIADQHPFESDTIGALLGAIMMSPVADLEELRPECPIALVDLIYRMLEKDRDARTRSVRLVGLELEDLLYGRDVNTPPKTRFEAPATGLLHRPKHNLPAQITEFVGRKAELIELKKLVADAQIRLITILAPGGMGKTRLSIEAGKQALDTFSDGVYFIDLAPIQDVKTIPDAIAQAIGISFENDDRDKRQQILDALAISEMLIIMDNYEHLLDDTKLVTDMLSASPKTQIIATSRTRLEQAGEALFHLTGMDFPDWETPEDALEYAAVKLFMNSAKRANPAFELSNDNLDYIARICRLVEGMPLGIILAASWLDTLTSDEIADEIKQGIDFLEAEDDASIPERQQSIRAVMNYSWAQMTEIEQAIFMKLAVFVGGFTRDAAQAVTGASLRNLKSLVKKSLLQRDSETGRYQIHELLRQYAQEILHNSGEEVEIQKAHAHYYGEFIAEREPLLKTGRNVAIMPEIEQDIENIQVAWDWACTNLNFEVVDNMLNGIWIYLIQDRQINIDGISFLSRATEYPWSESQKVKIEIRSNAIYMERLQTTDDDFHSRVVQIAEVVRGWESSLDLAGALWTLALSYSLRQNIQKAHSILDEVQAIFHKIDDLWWLAWSSITRCYLFILDDQFTQGLEPMLFAKSAFGQLGDQLMATSTNNNIGSIYYHLGEHEKSLQLFQASRTKLTEIGWHGKFNMMMLANEVHFLINLDRSDEALALAEEGLRMAGKSNPVQNQRLIYAKAFALIDLNRQDEALQFVHANLVQNSSAPPSMQSSSHRIYAEILWRCERYELAKQAIEDARKIEYGKGDDGWQHLLLGRVEVRLNALNIGETYLVKALNNMYKDIRIEAALGIAEITVQRKEFSRALELITMLKEIPHFIIIEWRRTTARLEREIARHLSDEDYRQAVERGKSLDFDETVQDIIAEYESRQ